MDDNSRIAMEAAAFRSLIAHLQTRPDVQNIDLMTLAGFCRNCLARWYREAGESMDIAISDAAAREHVYGMSYTAWQERHQTPASPAAEAAFATVQPEEH